MQAGQGRGAQRLAGLPQLPREIPALAAQRWQMGSEAARPLGCGLGNGVEAAQRLVEADPENINVVTGVKFFALFLFLPAGT